MKGLIIFLSLCIIALTHASPVSAQLYGEHIRSFATNTTINTDGTITVVETIVYDFSSLNRRGIFRTIPYVTGTPDGKKFKMDITIDSVSDEAGEAYQYESQTEGDYVKLKIGNPNKTITGVHTYKIQYRVKGALTYFSDHDELYWNITGNEWEIPIGEAQATVRVPSSVPSEQIGVICYTGPAGSTAQDCTWSKQGTTVSVLSQQSLQAGEGLTLAVKFPPGIVAELKPTEMVPFFDTFLGKVTAVVLAIGALVWYIIYPLWLPIRWMMKGRDPAVGAPVSAWFDPPQTKSGRPLTPAETGTLIDEHAGPREISALIVNLAQRGYFKIIEKAKHDYEFVKQKEYKDDTTLLTFERTLLRDLFSSKDTVRIKDAKLVGTVDDIQKQLYNSLVKEGFFPSDPEKIRSFYAVITGLAAFTFNFFLAISASIFGRLMPHKTPDGAHAATVSRGLKNFLTSQERQLKFQAEKQIMFEKLLPFAIAFGVEKIWAERFKDIELKQPDWYQGTYHGSFNSHSFTRSLNSSLSSFRASATPTSSTTGHSSGFSGGSSGGGGGGGGGGSW